MFVDRVKVTVEAGKGGDGCLSFRREKYVPRGGPDGGDGGKGGDVVLTSRGDTQSLFHYISRPLIRADNGDNGHGGNKTGKNGADIILPVPIGTVVKILPEGRLLFDFDRADITLVVARGGRGGRGNTRFKSSVNRAPRRTEKGQRGEKFMLALELKLIATVGLVGFPNAGKSTLLSKVSAARPKIADYPFTTLFPHLGVLTLGERRLVMADIPGIISGASRGEGMGLEFLRHIERTKVLLYLIDVSPYALQPPLAALQTLKSELAHYSHSLLKKKALVVANKIDLLSGPSPELERLRAQCRKERIPFLEISALAGTHLRQLKNALFSHHDQA